MLKFISRIVAGALAAGLLMASGAAFAYSHRTLDDHHDRGHGSEIIQGSYQAPSLLTLLSQPSMQITTRSGKTVTIVLTNQTQIHFEAQGQAGRLWKAVQNGKLWVSVDVVSRNNQLVATAIDGHVEASSNTKDQQHKKDRKKHHIGHRNDG